MDRGLTRGGVHLVALGVQFENSLDGTGESCTHTRRDICLCLTSQFNALFFWWSLHADELAHPAQPIKPVHSLEIRIVRCSLHTRPPVRRFKEVSRVDTIGLRPGRSFSPQPWHKKF